MNKSPYLELVKAQRLLQDEQGAYKILEHKEAKFKIQILDVYINEISESENEYEIWTLSKHLSRNEEKRMNMHTLLTHYH